MTADRDNWVKQLRVLMGGRPVRWAHERDSIGDYDGRERTLEVFNADVKDQRQLLRRLRPMRADLELAVGGPVIVIFHTTTESTRLYADFVLAALQEEAAEDIAAASYQADWDLEALPIEIELKEREGEVAGSGSRVLPRVAA